MRLHAKIKPLNVSLFVLVTSVLIWTTKATCSSSLTGDSSFTYKCNHFEWQCDSGDCIQSYDRCDGRHHCLDGSDETAKNCIHLSCPKYAFRCAYGACITGTKKCNGVQDCVDNSDETSFVCTDDSADLERSLSGSCSGPMLLQCKSGECIDTESRCDGVIDCLDGSDETVELCSHLYCPEYAFRCGYGGCIRGTAKCDHNIDCADGSDEAPELCGYERHCRRNQTTTNVETTTTTTTKKPAMKGCMIPFNRKSLLAENMETKLFLPLGTKAQPGSTIRFHCEPHYVLAGEQENTCLGRRWKYTVPFCRKYCSATTLSIGISTVANCSLFGHAVNCTENIRTGTRAFINCAEGYRQPKGIKNHRMLTCDADAEWNYPKFKCEPKCGIIDRAGAGKKTETPWQVSIYIRRYDGNWQYMCVGAIISPKLILTAAKCLVNSVDKPDNATHFKVILGHHKQLLSDGDSTGMKVFNVSEVAVTDYGYVEPHHDYQHDVGLLVLVNHIKFGRNIEPICLNLQKPATYEAPYERVVVNNRQLLQWDSIDTGYALFVGSRKNLTGIVGEILGHGVLLRINVNFYATLIQNLMRRNKYIL